MLRGLIHFYSETGTEGGHWAFQDEQHIRPNGSWSYEGLYILEDGDYLVIYDQRGVNRLWEGIIELTLHPLFQEEVFGYWIHADQKGVDRETWGKWFLDCLPAEMIKKGLYG